MTSVVARLLPEEQAAGGNANPEAQAKEVLESSEERVNAPHMDALVDRLEEHSARVLADRVRTAAPGVDLDGGRI